MLMNSKTAKNTTIDIRHHAWYSNIANSNPFITRMSMMRQAHTIYQQNYALLARAQRRLQDDGVFVSNAELVGLLLRLVVYGRITTVIRNCTVVELDNT